MQAVVCYLRRQTGNPEAAADLTAEVFAAALLSAHRYRDSSESAAPWLLGIARNTLRMSRRQGQIEDRARRRLGYEPVILEDPDLDRVEALAAGGSGVMDRMASLPATEREAIERRVLQERTYQEIAAELRCSELVVRKRISRGLARLRTTWTER
ncbi:RNA polymerase sigma factor [Actinospica sp.]|uniref:RNA polymerase sigma factor n=1 Tax=Actinospica sp. TaxID=1872142 RepID=UPI002C80D65A|nr:RNA polymerase sigma factor [Actinospica sp.]HWG26113.1 RNA polymerase sigma factor [Actinospica sp.]